MLTRIFAQFLFNPTFPHAEHKTWAQCERWLPLALHIVAHSEHTPPMIEETARLCYETASYEKAISKARANRGTPD